MDPYEHVTSGQIFFICVQRSDVYFFKLCFMVQFALSNLGDKRMSVVWINVTS